MDKFKVILQRAVQRKACRSTLLRSLPMLAEPRQLAAMGDDRYLAEMARSVFQLVTGTGTCSDPSWGTDSGWRRDEPDWLEFERAFLGFDPLLVARLTQAQIDALSVHPKIMSSRQKVASVQRNAQMMVDLAAVEGSFSEMVAAWPSSQLVDLFALLKRQGSRLGGVSGQRVLRNLGVDTYLLGRDVAHCLQSAGVQISLTPSSKKDLTLVQIAFNTWHRETGLPYSHLSRICAWSVGDNPPLLSTY